MNLKIFKIGELQFQDFDMIYLDKEGIGEDYMKFSEKQKERLPKGTPVLNVHIQRGMESKNSPILYRGKKARCIIEYPKCKSGFRIAFVFWEKF